jgi:hypothetical protein
MSYAIVGFGAIGQALARAFARKSIDVSVASHRPREALVPQALAIGPAAGCTRGRHDHPGGPVRGTSRRCEGPPELGRHDGHRRHERVWSSPRRVGGRPSSAFVATAFCWRDVEPPLTGVMLPRYRVSTRQCG